MIDTGGRQERNVRHIKHMVVCMDETSGFEFWLMEIYYKETGI